MSVFLKNEFAAKSSGEGGRESRERDRNRRTERSTQKASANQRERSPLGSRNRKNALERRVYVSNIPYEYRWQDLKDLFRKEVGEVSYVELFVDENDKPRGCGIVEFENIDSAQIAVEKMHRYDLKGRKLVVKEDTNVERDKQGRPLGFGGRSVNSGGGASRNQWTDVGNSSNANKWGNTYGLSPQFLESLNINGPLINKVFVANLDYVVNEKKLRDVFKLAGRVVGVDLLTDKDGKSRGFGTVEFEHPVEAVQAISMLHNQVLYDRRINVRMDKSNERDGPLKLPEGLKAVGMGLGANGAPLTDVARNLPTLNLSTVRPSSGISSPSNALAALAGSLSQQLDNRLLDNSLTRRQLEMVGSSLINNATAADLAGLAAASTPFGSGLNLNSSTNGTRGFVSGSHDFDALSAVLHSSVNKYDFDYHNTGSGVGSLRHSDTVMISNEVLGSPAFADLKSKNNFGSRKITPEVTSCSIDDLKKQKKVFKIFE
ncbi:heterogeneous nuclear ribonucleoprotein M isoform X3 [Planococcus citri]|uniref:heterogeneous nuclear ribonucleoprotein M isoform X3 n=1 Tax=Planococcus citri TaxID=170843 RepID=UPI0031F8EB13